MDRARRGYVLIAVLAALALCTALLGAFAATSRRAITLARADVEAVQAQYAARGAAIQAAKDLSVGLGRGRIGLSMRADEGLGGPGAGSVSTTIEGLPSFPPEMANAPGFLGILSRRMEEVRASAAAPNNNTEPDAGERDPNSSVRSDTTATAQNPALAPTPVVVTGLGKMEFSGAQVMISLESENGKLNLNTAPRRMLRDLLLAIGYEDEDATRALDAIEDYRFSQLAATSVARYANARREPDQPLGGRPFERIEEMLQVPAITPEFYEAIVPHMTVLGEGSIDPNYASEAALIAVGVRSPSLLKRIAEAKARREPLTANSMRELVGPAVYAVVSEHFAYSLTPLFTVRTRAEKGESVGRFMMRITIGESGVPTMLESREGWM